MRNENTKVQKDFKHTLKYINYKSMLFKLIKVKLIHLLYTLDCVLGGQTLRRFFEDEVLVLPLLAAFLSAVLVILPSLQPCNYNANVNVNHDNSFSVHLNYTRI